MITSHNDTHVHMYLIKRFRNHMVAPWVVDRIYSKKEYYYILI